MLHNQIKTHSFSIWGEEGGGGMEELENLKNLNGINSVLGRGLEDFFFFALPTFSPTH